MAKVVPLPPGPHRKPAQLRPIKARPRTGVAPRPSHRATTKSWSGVSLAVLAAVLWGLAPVATKAALAGYSPELISVMRLGMAALLFRVLGGTGTHWWPRNRWSWIGGIALGADFIMYNYGLRRTDAGLSGLIINVEMVTTIGLAVWLLGERLTRRRVFGSAVTLVGAAYVGLDGAQLGGLVARDRLLGNALVMLAGVAWSVFAVAQRKVPRRGGNLFQLLTPIFLVAALTSAPGLLLPAAWNNTASLGPTLMLLVLVLACTMGVYAAYARSQELVDVSVLAIVLAAIPVFAVAFAWLLIGEPITTRVVIGGAAILAGVLLITVERPATTAIERAL